MSRSPRTFYIETYGCQANRADSAKIANSLEFLGLLQVPDWKQADLLVLNSCAVRQKSEDKVYGWGLKLKTLKRRPLVILAGCMVGSAVGERRRYPLAELRRRTPWVDFYLAPQHFDSLASQLRTLGIFDERSVDDLEDALAQGLIQTSLVEDFKHAYVNISYGCDNFCSYCVVPYSRGAEISRSRAEILDETKRLLDSGVEHITLCGQNVNSWALSPPEKRKVRIGTAHDLPFATLLREVHSLNGVKRLSFISSNPFDFTLDLVRAMSLPKIDPYLHIAVQSGNNDILRKMNRHHTVEEFISLVTSIKDIRPDLRLGTDIIVGFPGETESQFMDTVKLFKTVKFRVAFISMYSPRKGTSAYANLPDDVPLSEKRRRHAYLTEIWKETLAS